MATFPANSKVPGVSTGLTSDLNSVYGLLQAILGMVVLPSGDTTGATDPVNVQAAITTYGQVILVAGGTYYGNATVVGHEGQWVHCQPGVTWNLKATSIAAFKWTMANTGSYSLLGTGGIIGRPQIVGPAGAAFGSSNPADGSIGVLMGDVVQLQADVVVTNCQYGLLLQNQYFWTEQGNFRLVSHGCTNPVVLQCAASGGASRTTSFERCDITVYHNETMSGSFGHGGVQLLAGALLDGGAIRQYGNFGGTGQASVYALYVSGQAPGTSASTNFSTVGAGTNASLDTLVIHHVEYNGTGTGPNSVFVDTSCSVTAWGALEYAWSGWGTSPVATGTFAFSGPISDTILASKAWIKITTGFPSGWSGTVAYRLSANNDVVFLSFALSIAASTVIAEPTTIATLPSGYYWASDNKFIEATYNGNGATSAAVTLRVNTSGLFSWVGGAITTPSGGASTIYGQAAYPVVV